MYFELKIMIFNSNSWSAVHKPVTLTTDLWYYSVKSINTNSLEKNLIRLLTLCPKKFEYWCNELPFKKNHHIQALSSSRCARICKGLTTLCRPSNDVISIDWSCFLLSDGFTFTFIKIKFYIYKKCSQYTLNSTG